MRTRATGLLAGVLVAGWAATAWAQPRAGAAAEAAPAPAAPAATADQPKTRARPASSREPGRRRSLELTASVIWLAPASLGSSAANLTSSGGGTPYTLFSSSADMQTTAGLEARASYNVTKTIAVEGGITYSRPGVSFTIANDTEGAAGFTSTGEAISQFFVDASVVGYVPRFAFARGRARPFVEGGAGYLRQLHGQSTATSGYYATDSGQVYHAGGGVKYFFRTRPTGTVRGLGLRFDARVYFWKGAYSFDGRSPKTFAAGAGFVVAF